MTGQLIWFVATVLAWVAGGLLVRWLSRRAVRDINASAAAAVAEIGAAGRGPEQAGICGDELYGPWGNLDPDGPGPFGVLWCDLPAGHLGWHGCQLPGRAGPTSWTHEEVTE